MKECTQWGEETRKECAEYRDEGYNKCNDWGSECCDWWPCSWGCEALTWFCIGWYWFSNVVCVAWTYFTTAVCVVWTVIVLVVSFIIEVIGVVVGFVISLVNYVVEVILSIPFLGRLLRELLSVIKEIIYRILGILDVVAWLIGIRPEKKLRLCAIILKDEKGVVADEAMVLEEVQAAIDIYYSKAKVRVIPVSWFHVSNPFSDSEQANDSYVHIDDTLSDSSLVNLNCGVDGWLEEIGLTGSSFNIKLTRSCFWGNARRLLGYGEPICVFVVRSINGASGCSMGPLNNYVTVVGTETNDKTTIAHEVGHTCGLWDISSPTTNLMFGTDNNARGDMTTFQLINMRNSKHVTYF